MTKLAAHNLVSAVQRRVVTYGFRTGFRTYAAVDTGDRAAAGGLPPYLGPALHDATRVVVEDPKPGFSESRS